jgi:hypothetical protein
MIENQDIVCFVCFSNDWDGDPLSKKHLAAGLPVVATAIPEAEKMKAVLRVARDKLDFLDQLDSIVQSGCAGPQMGISKKECESWDHKVEELSRILLKSWRRRNSRTVA